MADFIVALPVATLAAILSFLAIIVVSMPLGMLAGRIGLLTDEGQAWFGISFGIPAGILCAVVAFCYCLSRVLRRRRTV